MIFIGHQASKRQFLWVLIKGTPKFVRFEGLLPYQGFAYTVEDEWQETSDAAEFATEKRDLLDYHVAKQLATVERALTEIKRLRDL